MAWQRIHIDFAGPFQGKMYLIVVDAHSKWPEDMHSNTTPSLSYDISLQPLSAEFADFLKSNGVKHVRRSAYHPSSNGFTERFVRTFKQSMKAGERSNVKRLDNFLLSYRTTPHATMPMQRTPASLEIFVVGCRL